MGEGGAYKATCIECGAYPGPRLQRLHVTRNLSQCKSKVLNFNMINLVRASS